MGMVKNAIHGIIDNCDDYPQAISQCEEAGLGTDGPILRGMWNGIKVEDGGDYNPVGVYNSPKDSSQHTVEILGIADGHHVHCRCIRTGEEFVAGKPFVDIED